MDFKQSQLIPRQYLSFIKDIVAICNSYDNAKNPFFYEDSEEYLFGHDSFFYCINSKGNIAGFISLAGISETEFEACAFVLPEYRTQGIFSNLLKNVNIAFKNISVSLLVDSNCKSAANILHYYNFPLIETECKMIFDFTESDSFSSTLTLHKVMINSDIFYCRFFDKDTEIGTCTIHIVNHSYCILQDAEIKKEYRGLGLGTLFMCALCNTLIDMEIFKIVLHVTQSNIPAYRLYQSMGFQEVSKLDYYAI